MIKRAKISAVRANSFVVVGQFIVFYLVIRNSSNKRRIEGAALIRGRCLIEGGTYSSKYGNLKPTSFLFILPLKNKSPP